MLIGAKPDRLSHAPYQAATSANLEGVRARRASAKRSDQSQLAQDVQHGWQGLLPEPFDAQPEAGQDSRAV